MNKLKPKQKFLEDLFTSQKDNYGLIAFRNRYYAYKRSNFSDQEQASNALTSFFAINEQLKTIYETKIIEFLVTQGVLPNYAFTDGIVNFTFNIKSQKAVCDESDDVPPTITSEIQQPGSQGIRTLAPGNVFYFDKMAVPINNIELSNSEDKFFEEIKFCSKCGFTTSNLISNSNNKASHKDKYDLEFNADRCPSCNDGSFGQPGNRHLVLPLVNVSASVKKGDVYLTKKELNEERKSNRYIVETHFNFSEQTNNLIEELEHQILDAEYCANTIVSTYNYGPMFQKNNTPKSKKKGDSKSGFIVCTSCGRVHFADDEQRLKDEVQKRSDGSGRDNTAIINDIKNKFHEIGCQYYGKVQDEEFNEKHGNLERYKNIFLYSRFATESIKLIVPFFDEDYLGVAETLRAVLQLGLKLHFGSEPKNLKVEIHKEIKNIVTYSDDETATKEEKEDCYYLVIYDEITGGTGFLSDIYKNGLLREIFNKAFFKIKNCTCSSGCYNCIWTYRSRADKQLALSLWDEVVPSEDEQTSETEKNKQPFYRNQKEESQLELKFIDLLKRFSEVFQKHFSFKASRRVIGHYIFKLKNLHFTNGESEQESQDFIEEAVFEIVSQNDQNVIRSNNAKSKYKQLSVLPDFMIHCVSIKMRNDDEPLPIDADLLANFIKPIAIFLDGFAYHKKSFAVDLAKREMLINLKNSNDDTKYHCWSFTYQDIQRFAESIKYLDPENQNIESSDNNLAKDYFNNKHKFANTLFDMLNIDLKQDESSKDDIAAIVNISVIRMLSVLVHNVIIWAKTSYDVNISHESINDSIRQDMKTYALQYFRKLACDDFRFEFLKQYVFEYNNDKLNKIFDENKAKIKQTDAHVQKFSNIFKVRNIPESKINQFVSNFNNEYLLKLYSSCFLNDKNKELGKIYLFGSNNEIEFDNKNKDPVIVDLLNKYPFFKNSIGKDNENLSELGVRYAVVLTEEAESLKDSFNKPWNDFWQVYNLLQYFINPNNKSDNLIASGIYTKEKALEMQQVISSEVNTTENSTSNSIETKIAQLIKEHIYDQDYQELLVELVSQNIIDINSENSKDEEFLDGDYVQYNNEELKRKGASADIGFVLDNKLYVISPHGEESKDIFIKYGAIVYDNVQEFDWTILRKH